MTPTIAVQAPRPRLLMLLALAAGVLLSAGCQQSMPSVAFHAKSNPENLAAWHVVQPENGYLKLNHGVVPYGVNAKLFANYALKLRTIWMPKGKAAQYEASGPFDFPVGTIISKTFYYPLAGDTQNQDRDKVARTYKTLAGYTPGKGLKLAGIRLIETRLLVRRKQGWSAMTYTWNAEQTAARLTTTGALDDLVLVDANGHGKDSQTPFTYVVPSQSQCSICHDHTRYANRNDSQRTVVPIGPTAAHLNREFAYADGSENQLKRWVEAGYLENVPKPARVPRNADWLDASQPLTARARSYLDANCSYCHNPRGEANYTSLWLTASEPMGMHTGLCKTPVAAGKATGGRLFDIVPGQPDASIITHRMASTKVAVMMPELGRTLADDKAVKLIRAWIKSMHGQCTIVHGETTAP